MKSLSNYAQENINEGILDWLKNFWEWLTTPISKEDKDTDGFYRPKINYDDFDDTNISINDLTKEKYDKVNDKYITHDSKSNSNFIKLKYKKPEKDTNNYVDSTSLNYASVFYSAKSYDKEKNRLKFIATISYMIVDADIYIINYNIFNNCITKSDDIFFSLLQEIKKTSVVHLIGDQTSKNSYLEVCGFEYKSNEYIKDYNHFSDDINILGVKRKKKKTNK